MAQADQMFEGEIDAQSGAAGGDEAGRVAAGLLARVDAQAMGGVGGIGGAAGDGDDAGVQHDAAQFVAGDVGDGADPELRGLGLSEEVAEHLLQDAKGDGLGGGAVLAGHGDQEVGVADALEDVARLQMLAHTALDIGPDGGPVALPAISDLVADGFDADNGDGAARGQLRAGHPFENGGDIGCGDAVMGCWRRHWRQGAAAALNGRYMYPV